MTTKKYGFTGEVLKFANLSTTPASLLTLRRIYRLSDNLVGGWIEKEENLSQEGLCFIYDNAIAYGNSKVSGNAVVDCLAEIKDNAAVNGNAIISGQTTVVKDNAEVSSEATVLGGTIMDNACVLGTSFLIGNPVICDDAIVIGDCLLTDNVKVSGDAEICNIIAGGNDEISESDEDTGIRNLPKLSPLNYEIYQNHVYNRHKLLTFTPKGFFRKANDGKIAFFGEDEEITPEIETRYPIVSPQYALEKEYMDKKESIAPLFERLNRDGYAETVPPCEAIEKVTNVGIEMRQSEIRKEEENAYTHS